MKDFFSNQFSKLVLGCVVALGGGSQALAGNGHGKAVSQPLLHDGGGHETFSKASFPQEQGFEVVPRVGIRKSQKILASPPLDGATLPREKKQKKSKNQEKKLRDLLKNVTFSIRCMSPLLEQEIYEALKSVFSGLCCDSEKMVEKAMEASFTGKGIVEVLGIQKLCMDIYVRLKESVPQTNDPMKPYVWLFTNLTEVLDEKIKDKNINIEKKLEELQKHCIKSLEDSMTLIVHEINCILRSMHDDIKIPIHSVIKNMTKTKEDLIKSIFHKKFFHENFSHELKLFYEDIILQLQQVFRNAHGFSTPMQYEFLGVFEEAVTTEKALPFAVSHVLHNLRRGFLKNFLKKFCEFFRWAVVDSNSCSFKEDKNALKVLGFLEQDGENFINESLDDFDDTLLRVRKNSFDMGGENDLSYFSGALSKKLMRHVSETHKVYGENVSWYEKMWDMLKEVGGTGCIPLEFYDDQDTPSQKSLFSSDDENMELHSPGGLSSQGKFFLRFYYNESYKKTPYQKTPYQKVSSLSDIDYQKVSFLSDTPYQKVSSLSGHELDQDFPPAVQRIGMSRSAPEESGLS